MAPATGSEHVAASAHVPGPAKALKRAGCVIPIIIVASLYWRTPHMGSSTQRCACGSHQYESTLVGGDLVFCPPPPPPTPPTAITNRVALIAAWKRRGRLEWAAPAPG